MEKVLVVGSGASGVHFALTLLKKGFEVTMLDVGAEKPEVINPDDTYNDLKTKLNDPVEYFLGGNFESIIYPDSKSEYYGFPPNKNYVFSIPSSFEFRSNGFEPLLSFARGGLAEAWTGGVYPFNDHDLSEFPFSFEDIRPHYSEVSERVGIMGIRDDLERFLPFHGNIMEPLDLDEHSEGLLIEYGRQKDYLNSRLSCFFGRSRVTTLSHDKNGRKGCTYCGRCLWGCPNGALYTPLITLNECKSYSNFKYVPGMFVSHFKFDSGRRITRVVAEPISGNGAFEFPVDRLVLAAGTLSSSKIFLDSIFKGTGEIIKLNGLMDNRQIFVPFINLKMIGRPFNPDTYQYHQVALGIESEDSKEYIHGLITTLKTALVHPVIQSMPLDLKSSVFMFRNVHAALGVVNVNLHDSRRENNYLTLEADEKSTRTRLVINYSPTADESSRINRAVKKVTKALRRLGCIAPSAMNHIRPMGSSVHYSGTIPMSTEKTGLTTDEYCRSHDFDNLYIVDGTTFPFLPSKNLTFTLMANATRVAECAF